MKSKILFVVILLCFCYSCQVYSQPPVPEDYFDLYDNEPSEDDGESEGQNFDNFNLNDIQQVLNATGAAGAFPSSVISSGRLVDAGCDGTYICMFNTLIKVLKIAEYELEIRNSGELVCEERKAMLENYAMYLLSLNLDIYCIDKLHPDNNNLEDVDLINVMLAMRDFMDAYSDDAPGDMEDRWPMLYPYRLIRSVADPFCAEDLQEGDCSCENYSGTLDLIEKNKLLQDLRTIIDDINPLWQMQKAAEISGRLKALPCND